MTEILRIDPTKHNISRSKQGKVSEKVAYDSAEVECWNDT